MLNVQPFQTWVQKISFHLFLFMGAFVDPKKTQPVESCQVIQKLKADQYISHCKDSIIMSLKQFNKQRTPINEATCNPRRQKLSQILRLRQIPSSSPGARPGRGKSTGTRGRSAPVPNPGAEPCRQSSDLIGRELTWPPPHWWRHGQKCVILPQQLP